MTTITTEGISPEQRARFWRDAISDTFVALDCRIEHGSTFCGSLRQSRIGPLSYTKVEADGQHVHRLPKRCARDDEYVLVSIETAGRGVVRQDCREAPLEVGSFAIYDTVRPYDLFFGERFSQVVVQIPRSLLKERLGMTEHITAIPVAVNDPLAQLTRDYLLALGRFDATQDTFTVERVVQQAVDLLAMSLQSKERVDTIVSVPRTTLLFRVKQTIELYLGDAEFGLAALSACVGLSTRYINELFSDEGTSFGRYLLARRLQRCAVDMRDARMRHRTINDLAFSWGFNNMSHFSTAFRKHYGTSPRSYKAETERGGT